MIQTYQTHVLVFGTGIAVAEYTNAIKFEMKVLLSKYLRCFDPLNSTDIEGNR